MVFIAGEHIDVQYVLCAGYVRVDDVHRSLEDIHLFGGTSIQYRKSKTTSA